MTPLELWAGVECTVNRTGDTYRDQTLLSGHEHRLADFDLIADLGCQALRFPLLWERIAPDDPKQLDWAWSDARLPRLQAAGIRPIAGLVHHGSGPRYTDLLDDGFAPGLAAFARRGAERYPWIEDWTPVNEPVTTARFSALYGHWYPHHRDERSFWLALLNQIDAIRLAMQAIREIQPAARLIQTEDLGRTYATAKLGKQAAHDNVRRWAGWDLLFGRVTREHPLWDRLDHFQLGDRVRAIADAPCPPDILGVNHYLTSDRFLDHRLQLYPRDKHGGNGGTAFADLEAVRVLDPPPPGLAGAVRESWDRYRTPIAITEVHNGCTREEQLRWAGAAWDMAEALRRDQVDIKAVTAWALFGSHGWNTLLTDSGAYEEGLFDVSAGDPRPTALAALWKALPVDAPRHVVTDDPGWWQRPERMLHARVPRPAGIAPQPRLRPGPPVLICGATGTLGQALARACRVRGLRHEIVGRDVIDLEDMDAMSAALDARQPWAVLNATGWVRVDDAEDEEAACHRVNTGGAIALATACNARDIRYLGFSSDLVFDGAKGEPYVESDVPSPLSAYGRSKAAMEAGCLALPNAMIVRTAAFFSPFDSHNFAAAVRAELKALGRFAAAEDYVVTPTFVPQLAGAALDLLIDDARGLWHLSNGQPVSWAAFAKQVAVACGYGEDSIQAVPGAELGWRATRPAFAALGSERFAPLGPLDKAIERFAIAADR